MVDFRSGVQTHADDVERTAFSNRQRCWSVGSDDRPPVRLPRGCHLPAAAGEVDLVAQSVGWLTVRLRRAVSGASFGVECSYLLLLVLVGAGAGAGAGEVHLVDRLCFCWQT